MITETIKRPSIFLHATEIFRAGRDYVHGFYFLATYKYFRSKNPHPVLIIPSLATGDFATFILRRFIRKHGYAHVYPWGLGINFGNIKNIEVLSDKIEKIFAEHQKKITLIGWSMGGIYVRELAKQKPALVHQVITMGSPFAKPEAPNHAAWFFKLFNNLEKIDRQLWYQIPNPAPVMTTAIFSKQDGVVPWQACMELLEDATHKNIEIKSSHFGFPCNRAVFKIVGELL